MVALPACMAALLLFTTAALESTAGESNDALILIQHSLKGGSQVKPEHDALSTGVGKVTLAKDHDLTPEQRQKEKERQLRMKRIEREAKAKGCPAGYRIVVGDVPGGDQFGRNGLHKTETVELCAEDCGSKPECQSFEWSPNLHICIANKVAGTEHLDKPHQDFMLCVQNSSVPLQQANRSTDEQGAAAAANTTWEAAQLSTRSPAKRSSAESDETTHQLPEGAQQVPGSAAVEEVGGNATAQPATGSATTEEAAEPKAKEEEARRLEGEEAERKAKEEEETRRLEHEEAERRVKEEEAQRQAKEAAEQRAKEEDARRKAKEEEEEAERKAKEEETQRQAIEEAERKAKEEAEHLAREEAQRRVKEEEEARIAHEEVESKVKDAEAERQAKDEAERKAKEEARREANEALCSQGYHWVDGDVPGWDQFGDMGRTQATASGCGEACNALEDCLSFEWSPTTKICTLNKEHKPTLSAFEDYLFCQRTQEYIDKLNAKKKAAEENSARLQKEQEEAVAKVREDTQQEKEALRVLAVQEARARLERAEKKRAEDARRKAEELAAREARRKAQEEERRAQEERKAQEEERKAQEEQRKAQEEKHRKELQEQEVRQRDEELNKDVINIEDAAAQDEAAEKQAEEGDGVTEAQEEAIREAVEQGSPTEEEEEEAEQRAREEAARMHEEAARLHKEEEARQREALEAAKRDEEEQAAEARKKADLEAFRKEETNAKTEVAQSAKRLAEEKQKEEEEARLQELEKRDPVEGTRQRRRAEMKAKMNAALERKKLLMEKRKQQEDEEGRKQKALQDEIRRVAMLEEARRRKEVEEAMRRAAEEEARRRAAEEAQRAAEEEAQRLASEEATRQMEAEERAEEEKVMAASRPFEAENSLEDFANKATINLRIQGVHGKSFVLKVAKTVKLKVLMNAACARLGITLADAQFVHGGRLLKPYDTAGSAGLAEMDLIKVDDFIRVDDLIEQEETKNEDASVKAAREVFEAAQREWEGFKAKDTTVLSAVERIKLAEKEKADEAKWEAAARTTLESLPAPRSAHESREKALKVAKLLTEEELANLIHGSHSGQQGYYVSNTQNVSRLEIPTLRITDSSIRFKKVNKGSQKGVTCWPSTLALASTWDDNLVGEVAAAMATELRGRGANVFLGPSVAVQRVALAGRNFEQLSGEDPYLGARLVRPFVRGMQGAGVMASVRPFGFYQQETNRKSLNVEVTDKTAWELYYPPFEAAVQAGVGAVTCISSKVNGTSNCESADLLLRDLKGGMRFQGFVMSEETVVGSSVLDKGLDMNLPGSTDKQARPSQVASRDNETRREAAARVLTSIYRSRMDEFPEWQAAFGQYAQNSDQRTKQSVELARKAATSAVTLLKNNGVLPLDPERVQTIAVLGTAADTAPKISLWSADYYSGGGPAHVPAANGPDATALTQITKRAASAKIRVVVAADRQNMTAAKEAANAADVVVVVAATTSTEGFDRESLALDDKADELIAAVAQMKPTVVLMQTPGAVLTPWRDSVAAVANLFLAGEATGLAWASLLFGDVSPSGRLPLQLPKTEEDTIRPETSSIAIYKEGLHTSYRSSATAAAFPFGHGLSYTLFSYGTPQPVTRGCLSRVCLRLEIANTGHRPGAEVAQAYVTFPAAENMPKRLLRSFQKTEVLQPGKKEEVFLVFTTRDLSTYHSDIGWVEQSNIKVEIGSSSLDIRQTTWVNLALEVDVNN